MKNKYAILDIGNTRTKLCYFKGLEMSEVQYYSSEEEAFQNITAVEAVLFSTVKDLRVPESLNIPYYILGPHLNLPFDVQYENKDSLGADRLALAAAAVQKYRDQACLVIDAGTCITYELIINQCYLGGAISPGLQMRAKAMHEFTSKLPVVDPSDKKVRFPAKNTRDCLKFGAREGFQLEIEAMISKYAAQYPKLNIVLTGGDAEWFEIPSNYSIFADPNFLLKGLNFILQHNVQQA